MNSFDLFPVGEIGAVTQIGDSSFVLHGFALPHIDEVLHMVFAVASVAPFRHMVTPGGFTMSVAMTNCGTLGWTTDRKGYRYTPEDPSIKSLWPAMPDIFNQIAKEAAYKAGFNSFVPDACLINRYLPGNRLTLHQDKNEKDFTAPIVSISLGLPATFLFGGHARNDSVNRIPLIHGDVAVWGGADRLRYHGVLPLKAGFHKGLGGSRINLTLRKAA